MKDTQKGNEGREPARRPGPFVCQHLAKEGALLGFNRGLNPEDPDEIWPYAWCDACEDVLVAEGDWTDRVWEQADLHLVCEEHYDATRRKNWRQDVSAYAKLVHKAYAYLQQKQNQLEKRYRLGEPGAYEWDQGSGELVFSNAGKATVIADFQFVGSTCTTSKTWMWSWANASIAEPIKSEIRRVRTYGENHSFRQLASALWFADQTDAWEMTAITAYLLRAQGAYRSPDEGRAAFLVMKNIRWVD